VFFTYTLDAKKNRVGGEEMARAGQRATAVPPPTKRREAIGRGGVREWTGAKNGREKNIEVEKKNEKNSVFLN
jgi:hypothetical protein